MKQNRVLYAIIRSNGGVPTDKPTMTTMYVDVWLPTPPKLTARPARLEFIAPGITPPAPHKTRHVRYGISPEACVLIAPRRGAI